MASGILLRAPLHVLGILLYSAFFVVWLVCRALLGFSFPPFPPGRVRLLLSGIGVSVRGLVRDRVSFCHIYLLFFH